MRHATIGLALLASLLLAAAPASAIYIVTPLRATASDNAAEVGDTIDVVVDPENETTAAEWAGKLVLAFYAYDASENADHPDGQTSSDSYVKELINDSLALDETARASFSWTVPQDADDHNVAIRVESPEGELLAVVDITVGDAPPIMRALAGTDGGSPEPIVPENETAENFAEDGGERNDTPALGVFAVAALAGVVALVLRRRFI